MNLLNTYDTRQKSLWAIVDLLDADMTDGVAVNAIEVPQGAVVVGGFLVVDTISDDSGTDTIDVGDSGDDDRYTASAISIKTAARTALTLTGYEYTTLSNIQVLRQAQNADGSAFVGRLFVEYVRNGRADENQGGI